jgi:hypothetical protein
MRFILHSHFNANSVRENLGKPAYSYYFVLKTFQPVLEQLGTVVLVQQPEEEVDPIYEACTARGEACVFISFSPPDSVPVDLKCPTIVLFAWEFSTLPDGSWDGADLRDDWRYVFNRVDAAISLSNHTAAVVKDAMGVGFPILAIATPIWDRRPHLAATPAPIVDGAVKVRGEIVDTRDYLLSPEMTCEPGFPPPPVETPSTTVRMEPPDPEASRGSKREPPAAIEGALESDMPNIAAQPPRRGARYRLAVTKRYIIDWYHEAIRDLLPDVVARAIALAGNVVVVLYRRLTGWKPPPPPPPPAPPSLMRVTLRGVVYTSMFNPTDGRKNWHDILSAFCWTFREVEDATLVLKMVKGASHEYRHELFLMLSRLAPYKCRVVAMDGFLEDAEYDALIAASSFYVNASGCEGLCMPIMEFMSAGRPVIAPRHTAMADYINEDAAFIVASSPEHNVWPMDPRRLYTTMRERIHWDTLAAAFADSYRVAKQDPARYRELGRNAAETMRLYCSDAVVREKLRIAVDTALEASRKHTAAQIEPDQATAMPSQETA